MKEPLDEDERGKLKLNIQKTKIMASGPITWWQIDGGKVKTVSNFIFLGSKITVDGDSRHEIKRHLLLGRKAMTKLDSVLQNGETFLLTKVCITKAMIFPLVMYSCESWIIKKAEHQSIDAFELWSWSRLLSIPWLARRSNQSILKEMNPEYSLEGPMLTLSFQNFCHLAWRADWLEKTLMVGKIEGKSRRGDRGWDEWVTSSTQRTWAWANSGDSEGQGSLMCCSPRGCKESHMT